MNIDVIKRRVLASVKISNDFIFTVKSDNAGTSNSDQFTIPTNTIGNTIGYNYDIVTSDGYTATGVTGNHTITFPSGAGVHTVTISGSFPRIFFNNGGDRLKFLELKNFGIYGLGSTNQQNAFRGCSNMTITAEDIGHFGNVNNFNGAWGNCSSLTTFPLIDTSNGTTFGSVFNGAWQGCSSLTSFPLINTQNATSLLSTWRLCTGLLSFPQLNTSNVIDFQSTWQVCNKLTSFPFIDTSKATNISFSWSECSQLTTYPSNAFDNNIATNYNGSFLVTNLTTQSIDHILVSLDTSGVNNGTFSQSGGQAPSVGTGRPAIDNLRAKGWTVTVTGGY